MRTHKIAAIAGASIVAMGIGFAAGIGVKSATADVKPMPTITTVPACIDGFVKVNEKNNGLTYECKSKAPVCGTNYGGTAGTEGYAGGVFKYGCEKKPGPVN